MALVDLAIAVRDQLVQVAARFLAGDVGEALLGDAAEIHVHPNGKFLYASNRGHDSIAVFSVDPAKGTLTPVEYVPTQGKAPRYFAIDPTGSRLFVANQNSGNIMVFHIDPVTGRLTATGQVLEIASPVCLKFVAIK